MPTIKFDIVAIKLEVIPEYLPSIYREEEPFPYSSPLHWFNIDFKAPTYDITLALFNENIIITNDGNTLTPTEIAYVSPGIYRVTCELPYDSETGGSGIPLSVITYNGLNASLKFLDETPIPAFTLDIIFGFIDPI